MRILTRTLAWRRAVNKINDIREKFIVYLTAKKIDRPNKTAEYAVTESLPAIPEQIIDSIQSPRRFN